MVELSRFLNSDMQLVSFPAKRKLKLQALFYLAGKIEPDRQYNESEINALLLRWHTFDDPATLRRELFIHHFLNRTADGSCYWLADTQPTIEDLLQLYG